MSEETKTTDCTPLVPTSKHQSVFIGMPAPSPAFKHLDGTPVALKNTHGICHGAMPFNCMALWCVAVGLVLPIVCLVLADAEENETLSPGEVEEAEDAEGVFALRMVALIAFLSALVTCCCSLGPLWNGGVLNQPTPPARLKPLRYAFTGRRRAGRVASELRKVMVVVNPGSGVRGTSNDSLALYERLKTRAARQGVACFKQETAPSGPRFATNLVLNMRREDNYDAVIVIGGDGTFFQCVNGMLQRPPAHRVPIGVIPGGSGNSVMADLGIRGHNEDGEHQAMDYCLSGDYAWVDVNQVTIDDERRIFSVNELTWGLTGDVGADSEKGRCFGPLRYSVCGIWGVLRNPLRPIKVTIKDTNQVYEDDMATVFVNQTQHFGKEMRAAPAAVLDDGFFDLNIMFKQTRGMLLRVFALLPTGAHTHAIPGTVERQARHVVMEPRSPGVINVDGENFNYQSKIEIECIHKGLKMLLPYKKLCDPPEAALRLINPRPSTRDDEIAAAAAAAAHNAERKEARRSSAPPMAAVVEGGDDDAGNDDGASAGAGAGAAVDGSGNAALIAPAQPPPVPSAAPSGPSGAPVPPPTPDASPTAPLLVQAPAASVDTTAAADVDARADASADAEASAAGEAAGGDAGAANAGFEVQYA